MNVSHDDSGIEFMNAAVLWYYTWFKRYKNVTYKTNTSGIAMQKNICAKCLRSINLSKPTATAKLDLVSD